MESISAAEGVDLRDFAVFLTYNSRDEPAAALVKVIAGELEADDKRAWFDKVDKVSGELSTDVMAAAVKDSRCCAFFCGAEGLGKWQDQYELQLAFQRRVNDTTYRVFAVLLPGAPAFDELPPALQISTAADLREAFEEGRLTDDGREEILATVEGISKRDFQESRRKRQAEGSGRHRALLIGVSDYADEKLESLHGPRNDIEQLSNALKASSATPIEWKVESRQDPDSDTFRRLVMDFFQNRPGKPPDDTLLLYYSGHGVTEDGASYLCAKDTRRDQVSVSGFPARGIADLVRGSNALAKVVILDCCNAAPIPDDANPYERLEGDVAVIIATRGLADDAKAASLPSPFTRLLISTLRNRQPGDDDALTVDALLTALERGGQRAWTNRNYAGGIRLVARAARAAQPAQARRATPELPVNISMQSVPETRLPLIRQLAVTLDALLAMAGRERDVPSAVVRQTVQLLANELGDIVLGEEQLNQLAALPAHGSDTSMRLALRFADTQCRSSLADLPWEYLAFCAGGNGPVPQQGERLLDPRAPVERLFEATRTKAAETGAVQQVALFSSLDAERQSGVHTVTKAASEQLGEIGLTPQVSAPATWAQFVGSPKEADAVVLHLPVTWEDGGAKALFAATSAGDMPKRVQADDIAVVLNGWRALTWVFIETLADTERSGTAPALRRLADDLASRLERTVVAVCHARAYTTSLAETPTATSFLPHLISQLRAGAPIDQAAHTARHQVASTLGANEPAIVGIPIVVRPEARDEPEPTRRPTPRA